MTTDIIHKSKIGFEILIPTVMVLGTTMTVMILNDVWIGIVVCGLVGVFILNIYAGTSYRITPDNRLLVTCGLLSKFEINIADIDRICMTSELSNAPALSVDRLEINYKGGRILVSPKDKK